ncbi:MAG: tRNA (adenosine(37)-N6)-dimethylallyltransferase MiaA [Pseudomonadota bacterium]
MKPVAYALLGPTASGKSRLAMQLASQHPIEIVSVDSAQVYRGMDIGTAKPSAEERRAVPHHLIDLLDPTERYSAGRFREDAIRAVAEIHSRGKIPLLVGGTMLYYRALSQGLDELPPANPTIRAQIDADASKKGWPALHAELAKLDPKTAARLKPGDAQRIQRALEVHRLTGKPISELQNKSRIDLPFELRAFSLFPENRSELHQLIAERFDEMLKAGLVEELKALRKKFQLSAELPSMRCVGYRQAWEFLDGKSSEKALRETAIAATRQLAKRQLTWLRSLPGLEPAEQLAAALERNATRV